jgi:hypothetical protein
MKKIEYLNSKKFSNNRIDFSELHEINGGASGIEYSYDYHRTIIPGGHGDYCIFSQH